jgi:hypothetical protein
MKQLQENKQQAIKEEKENEKEEFAQEMSKYSEK